MVEKRLLAVFMVTCALGLAVVLNLFQLHVHSGSGDSWWNWPGGLRNFISGCRPVVKI